MIVTTVFALVYYTGRHLNAKTLNIPLIVMDFTLLALAGGFIVMTGLFLARIKRIRAEAAAG